ncbi:class I SAM-dependent methyltransferase [Paenibacillus pinihumi]|uniref:class I SAM-dependent methyltransferase n=1 Tax=Paenibacillus pinihumi TaxID=669462 RepID=UPI00040F8F9E|nr:class I SAM-dependent methyltransferase [Paenibacillus pinihumi]
MNDTILEDILDAMKADKGNNSIQRVQSAHRIKLAEFWGVAKGDRILEIGCGQGDTTAVLAYMAGEEGLVQGIDIASPDYGSPLTLGESAAILTQSRLGKQIRIDFEMDVLSPGVDFPEQHFDKIVLSHCSWYLKSFEELSGILQKVKRWGKTLCFAEWDARIQRIEQFPHFLAISIQAKYESYKVNSHSNLRSLFTPADIKALAEQAGWSVVHEASLNSSGLQDGGWEIDMTLSGYKQELDELPYIPSRLKMHIESEARLLQTYVHSEARIESLSTFAFTAN